MKKSNKNGFNIKWVIMIIIATAVLTSTTTGVILYNNNKLIFGKTSLKEDKALQEFLKVYRGLEENYYADIDKDKMIDAAISGMLDYLGEDYSTYLDQQQSKDLANSLSGKYEGIGISISSGNKIVKVHEDTPAMRAGLKENDVILMINNVSTQDLQSAEVANLINKTGDNEIKIDREGNEMLFHVKGETINTPLTSQLIEEEGKKIGYIFLNAFTNTVGEEFKKSLYELESQGIEGLIIDVRYNYGGYLKGATDIANLLLEKGKIIYSLEGKDNTEIYRDQTDEKRTYPIVVLVNESSASASEVLAASLKDSYGATLVGQITYGKGRVQQAKTLEDGSMVKYTTARWLRPTGECIDEYGLTPDYIEEIVKNEDGTYTDNQYEKAKELLFK